MTQKRFNRVGGYVYDGDKCISHFEDVSHRDDIVKLLNELHEKYIDEFSLRETLQLELQRVEEENKQLKAQLLYDGDGVCNICKHQCLVKTGKYYVAKCEKEHEECSKIDLQYCEDFELVRDYE